MRSGLLRSLSGLLSAAAFAIGVASPVQFCPCPTHGATLPPRVSQPEAQHAGHDMAMPAADGAAPAAAQHANHGGHSQHATHQCTCPGGCCATTPVSLTEHALSAALGLSFDVRATLARPADAVQLAANPQLAQPPANAPPSSPRTLPDAAKPTT